ncbi:MAG: hypothetical protein IJE43_08585 [Alphaproteobacteria bacterium]|nr:hypothetical protein [Alphaproteobacteria bacterium]
MQSENVYIGDDKFNRFLEHYSCPTPIEVVKMRFAGAICSPNSNLRPTDVISSIFLENQQPRLSTKAEAELFFRFFMGLWDEMFIEIKTNTLKLSKIEKKNRDNLVNLCIRRADEIERGFVEGFWGGCETLNIPNFAAELVSSLTDLSDVYMILAEKLKKSENTDDILQVIENTDKTVEKTFSFLIENMVIPNISKLERNVN